MLQHSPYQLTYSKNLFDFASLVILKFSTILVS